MPDRYLDPEMTEAAMRGRVGLLMERDWETLAGERRAQLEGEGWAVVSLGDGVLKLTGYRIGLCDGIIILRSVSISAKM